MLVGDITFLLIRERILGECGISLYEDNREYVRFSPPRRTTQSLLEAVIYWRSFPQGGERARSARGRRITRYSNLWTLYHLYGFDLPTDLIYDTMHILALCVFKKYVSLLVQTFIDLGREKNLEEALRVVSQPACRPKGLGQRWPTSLDSLGFFKAKEYTNFILWCLPFILEKLQIEKHFVLGSLGVFLTEVGRLFFVNT